MLQIELKSSGVVKDALDCLKKYKFTEKDYFFVQDSARLAYCDALSKMAQETGMKNCIKNDKQSYYNCIIHITLFSNL